jgi:catechol 2,3-dioxygenase-like lactoylglutathione lyase family enzyme
MTTSNNSPLINGAHVIIYSTNPDADRDFLKDVLALAVHPADENGRHELYLMCDDVEHFVTQMRSRGPECAAVADQGWGLVTQMTLPGGGAVGVYQPRHPRPDPMK